MQKPKSEWTFNATDDEHDGVRILREAIAAGAQLVQVERDGGRMLFASADYFHRLMNAGIKCGKGRFTNGMHDTTWGVSELALGERWVVVGGEAARMPAEQLHATLRNRELGRKPTRVTCFA